MIILIWGIFFVWAIVPGAIVGMLAGLIPTSTRICAALLVLLSIAAGLIVPMMIRPHGSHAHVSWLNLFEDLLMYAPPILLATLIGLAIARAKYPTPEDVP